jgi:MOSC domain-containing protein YiiM
MKKDVLKVGTLIKDHNRIGVISKVIEVGQLDAKVPIISWRANYEITYTDGTTLLLSCKALENMVKNGVVQIYHPTTPLPPSLSTPTGSHIVEENSSEN